MRALLICFFLAVTACTAEQLQTLPAVNPADGQSSHQTSTSTLDAEHQETDKHHHGHTGLNPGFNQGFYPGFPGQFPGFPGQFPSFPGQFPGFPGQFPSFPGQFPGVNPGQFPGFFPGQFPGFGQQQPFPGFGR